MMGRAGEKSSQDAPNAISPVEAKLWRIEELATQIAGEDERLGTFWQELSRRLSLAQVEAWADDLLECSCELLFDEDSSDGEQPRTSSGARGLQFGFAALPGGQTWGFRVRPASVVHGSTLYSSLEKPEPNGESRALEQEPRAVRLAALQQLPELLDRILGSLNDTVAVARVALGDPVEANALVSSPFSRRGQSTQSSVVKIGDSNAAKPSRS
ncbi:MAG: hypothetical protein NZ990_12935 [Myxococcota bacterium]|nr:hypothetical protein [Myxococcota bacterium]